MSIPNVLQLKINLLTNFQEKKVTFQKDLLSSSDIEVNNSLNSSDLSSYPYICLDHAYPDDMFNGLYYYDMVEIIFNENRLVSHITSVGSLKISNDVSNKNYSINRNVLLTLKALFPTSFPVIDDITSSIDYVLKNTGRSFFNFNTGKRIANNIYYGKQFSYLNYDNNFYTFSKLIFVNDIMNHPIYEKILKSYNNYYKYISDIILTEDIKKYDILIKQINDTIKNLLIFILKDFLLEISKSRSADINKSKDKDMTGTFKTMLKSLFTIKHVIDRIYIDHAINCDGFKVKLANILETPEFTSNMHERILQDLNLLVNNYEGILYYQITNESDPDYEDFVNNNKSSKNVEIVLQPPEGKEKNYRPVKIDDIYEIDLSDEIKKNYLKTKNATNFLILFSSFVDPKNKDSSSNMFTAKNNIPQVYNNIVTNNFPGNKTYRKYINQIKELNEKLRKTTNTLKNSHKIANSDVNDIDRMLRENNISIRIESKYTDQWKRYKNQFKIDKTRTTTNDYLQELIEKENLDEMFKDNEAIKNCRHISNIFPNIYKKFVTINRDINNECNEISNLCTDVGVSIIKQTDNNQVTEYAEIYVISDFIKDKINQENIKDIKCGYIDNKLGYMINNVFYNDRYNDSNYWKLREYRDIINSDENNEEKINDLPKNEKNFNNEDINKYASNTAPVNRNETISNQRVKDKFRNFLDENVQIKQKLEQYNQTARTRIEEIDLYDKFKNEFPGIESLLIKWTDTEYYNNEQKILNLEQSFINVKSELKKIISLNDNIIKKYKENLGLFTEEQVNKAKYKYKIFSLFFEIVDELDNKFNSYIQTNYRRNPMRNNRAKGGKKTRRKGIKKNKSRKI